MEIPAGTYLMRDALHLRDRVQVVGEPGTILKKVPSVESPLADYLGYGHYEFTVAEPEKFEPGMGVLINDSEGWGFYETVATIVDRKGRLFFIDRMLNHDYDPRHKGKAATVHSLIEGVSVRDASAKGLTLDGNPEETRMIGGCRGGAAYLLQAHEVRLEGLEILNFRGDAISFQQCTDVRVADCHIHDNGGGGIHPGSGSVRYEILRNHVHDNKENGVFYCLRTTHSRCEQNRIRDNGKAGISVGDRDTDHLIRGNLVTGNGGNGIEFRAPITQGGDRVSVEDNTIESNCRGNAEHEIRVAAGIHDVRIAGNKISPRRGKALFAGTGCSGIRFYANVVSGRPQSAEDACAEGEVTFKDDEAFPPVGPGAVKSDSARHLGIEKLGS